MLLVRIPRLLREVGEPAAGPRVAGEREEPLQPKDAPQRRRAVAEGDRAAAQQLSLAEVELTPQPVDPTGGVLGQRRGHVVGDRVGTVAGGDPAPDVLLDDRHPAFGWRAVGQVAQLLDQAAAVGAEQVFDQHLLVPDLVHGRAEDRCRVPGRNRTPTASSRSRPSSGWNVQPSTSGPQTRTLPSGSQTTSTLASGTRSWASSVSTTQATERRSPRSSATATARNQGRGGARSSVMTPFYRRDRRARTFEKVVGCRPAGLVPLQ